MGAWRRSEYSWESALKKYFVSEDKKKNEVVILCPERLCLYKDNDFNETLLFLEVLAGFVHTYGNYVVIDMSQCKYISAAAALVYFSEISKCRSMSTLLDPNRIVTVQKSNDADLMRLMRETSLWDVIRTGAQRNIDDLGDNDHVYFCTGNDPSSDIQKLFEQLQRKLGLQQMPPNVARAINEAFLNVVHHAYHIPESTDNHNFIGRRWWLYCSIQDSESESIYDKDITFLIYDKGMGIPATVANGNFNSFRRWSGQDHLLIQKAFESGFTCTPHKRQGLGSNCIQKPLYNCQDSLLVFSGKGVVYFKDNGNVDQSKDLDLDVGGTLLEWKLYI